MGCCLTTAATAVEDDSKPRHTPPLPPSLIVFEEESVKEVLSETPVIPKQPPPSKTTGDNQPSLLRREDVEFTSGNKNPIEENASEVSSELYTCSASFSAATTTTTIGNGIDEDGEVTQKVNKYSSPSPSKLVRRKQQTTFSGDRSGRKERGVRQRQSQPSPAKRPGVPSTDKKSQVSSRNITTGGRHRNVVPSNVVRREPPARRSRSPAMRGEVGQLRKFEKSPVRKSGNRVPVTVTEKGGNVMLKKADDVGVLPVPVPEPESEPETGESFENPLVSLECFIFL